MQKWMEGNLPRRGLAMALCLCMVLSLMPLSAFAEEEPAGTTVQETTVPEVTVPETTVSEETVPETTVPEETVPETTVPEETVPETTVPEVTVPETTVPEETVPETTVPEETVPETTVPEETVPETTVPEETVPETSVPEATAPSHDCDGELEPVEGDQGESLWVCPVCGAVLDAQGNALPPLLSDCSAYGAQAVGVQIDDINFPDDNFRRIVMEFDKDGDGALSTAEIAAVDEIDCFDRGISSLKGIEYFTELTVLYCGNNQLSSLDVSSNTALTELHCSRNKLTSLDVGSNRDLTVLNCSENQLSSLDVRSNTALTVLYCSVNQLTSLDVSSNRDLTTLLCDGNQLTSLVVSSNRDLTVLNCSGNQLTSLDLRINTDLTILNCSDNKLSSLDLPTNTKLTQLFCNLNQLTSLDVSSNPALTKLECYNNQLSSLDVSSNPALNELRCQYNQLASLDVSSNPALQGLECSGNALTSLDLSKNTALTGANFYGQKASGYYIQRDGAYLLDMAKVVGPGNLPRVSVTSGGTYDDSTGMVTLNAPTGEDTTIEVKYNYTVGFYARTMSVTLTLSPHTHSFDENGDCICGLVRQVSYVDAKGNRVGTQVCTILTEDTTTLEDGWYVASGSVTVGSRLACSGGVNLILEDGCSLTASNGIRVSNGRSLDIYAQSTEEGTMGKLFATAGNGLGEAGIGCTPECPGGYITIHGGVIDVRGGKYGAGIGGNSSGGSYVSIHGGVVKAYGNGYGAGIGSSGGGKVEAITITGGIVTAVGGDSGPGIGSWDNQRGGTFSTGSSGSAVIFASSIETNTRKLQSGVVFEGDAGKVYGSPTLSLGLPIPEKTSLTLDMNSNSLTFAQGTGIALNSGSTLKLTGPGTFSNGVSVTGGTLGDLLAEGWAYRQDGSWVTDTTVSILSGTVEVLRSPNYLDLTGEHDFDNQADITIGGVTYPIRTDNGRYVILPDTGDLLTIYTYANVESEDVHQTYPNSMSVYRITRTDNGATVEKLPELNDLLQYSGCSIRNSGKQGIRMITSLTKENKAALKKGGLAGFTLEEYGTVVQWADALGGDSLTLETGKHNYAYKKGKADPVFATTGNLTQYTNVLVWSSLTDEQLGQDIIMRPYITLKDAQGQTVTLYGGTVARSIGYIAWQNRDTYKPGTAGYKYVWNIIHAVYGDQYDSEL